MAVVVARVANPGGHLPPLDQLADYLPFDDPTVSSARGGGSDRQ